MEERNYEAKLNSLNETERSVNGTNYNAETESLMLKYVYIYTGIVAGIFLIAITRSSVFYKTCMTCSQRLHDMMFSALIRTGMRFFDTNASGRILNRFSKDMGAIDELLPKAILDAGQMNMMMLGSLLVICVVKPIFIAPIVIISVIFYLMRKVYLKTSKNVKRLEGIGMFALLLYWCSSRTWNNFYLSVVCIY